MAQANPPEGLIEIDWPEVLEELEQGSEPAKVIQVVLASAVAMRTLAKHYLPDDQPFEHFVKESEVLASAEHLVSGTQPETAH